MDVVYNTGVMSRGNSTPKSFKKASLDPDWVSMDVEMNAITRNDTYELVEQQPGDQVIGCQWVYAQKYGPDGEVVKLKSRVVAMGNQQTDGVDTHSPVATNSTFKSLLAIAAKKGYTVSTADVRSAYLHGECKEKVLMRQPPGYVKLAPNGKPYIYAD